MRSRNLHLFYAFVLMGLATLLSGMTMRAQVDPIQREYSFGAYKIFSMYKAVISPNGKWAVLYSKAKTYVWDTEANQIKDIPSNLIVYGVSNDGTFVGSTNEATPFIGKLATKNDYKVLTASGSYGLAFAITPDGSTVCGAVTTEADGYKYQPVVWKIGETIQEIRLPKSTFASGDYSNCIATDLSDNAHTIVGVYSPNQYGVSEYGDSPKVCAGWVYDDATSSYKSIDLYEKFDSSKQYDGKYVASDMPAVSRNGLYIVGSAKGKLLDDSANDAVKYFAFRYNVKDGEMKFLSNAPLSNNATAFDDVPMVVLDNGTVYGYSGEHRVIWNTKAIFSDENFTKWQGLKDHFATNKIAYPEILEEVDMVGTAYMDGDKLVLLTLGMKQESNPTLRLLTVNKSEPTPDPTPDPTPSADGPFPGGKKLAPGVWQYSQQIGDTNTLLFLRRAHISSNHKFVFLGFGDAGVALWNVSSGKNVESIPAEMMHAEAISCGGIVGGQLDTIPAVGTPGNWTKLPIDANTYGSVEALSNDARFAAGWTSNDQVYKAYVWDVEASKRYELPVPTDIQVLFPKPVGISDNGKVVVGNFSSESTTLTALWVWDDASNGYVFKNIHKGRWDADPSKAQYQAAIASGISANGKWICGTIYGKYDLSETNMQYYGYAYNVETGEMHFLRYGKDADYTTKPIQLFGVADNGIVVGAQTAFGSAISAQPIYGDANGVEGMMPIQNLFEEKGLSDYELADHASIVGAISPDTRSILLYEVRGGEEWNKEVRLIYFNDPVPASSRLPQENNVKFYPTVVSSMLNYAVSSDVVNTPLRVFSLDGRLMMQENIHSENGSISLAALPAAIYVVKVGNTVVKIIKK